MLIRNVLDIACDAGNKNFVNRPLKLFTFCLPFVAPLRPFVVVVLFVLLEGLMGPEEDALPWLVTSVSGKL